MAHHYSFVTDDSNGWDDVDYALNNVTVPDISVMKNPRHVGQLIDSINLSSCKAADGETARKTTLFLRFEKYPSEITSQNLHDMLRTISDAFDHPQNGCKLIIGTTKKKKERQITKANFALDFMRSRLVLSVGEVDGCFALVIQRDIRNNYMHQLTQKLLCYLEEHLQDKLLHQTCGFYAPTAPMIKKDISFKEAIKMAKDHFYKGYKVPKHKQV